MRPASTYGSPNALGRAATPIPASTSRKQADKRGRRKQRDARADLLEQHRFQLAVGPRVAGIGQDRVLQERRRIVAGRADIRRHVPGQVEIRQIDVVDGVFRDRPQQERQIDLPVQQARAQVDRDIDVDFDLQPGKAAVQRDRRNPAASIARWFRTRRCADSPRPHRDRPRSFRPVRQAVRTVRHISAATRHPWSASARPRSGRKAPWTRLSLEVLDARGDGRLRQVQHLGRLADTAKAHDGQKGRNLIEIDSGHGAMMGHGGANQKTTIPHPHSKHGLRPSTDHRKCRGIALPGRVRKDRWPPWESGSIGTGGTEAEIIESRVYRAIS